MTFKQKLQNLIFPLGSVQEIRRGFLRGYRIRLTENSLWSPLIGRWEPAMQHIMKAVLKTGQVAYDIGANNGLHGLWLSHLVGPSGRVINFEPLPANIEEIKENFALNNLTNADNVCAAVADINGKITFEIGKHNKQGHISGSSSITEGIEVDVITLDSFINKGNPLPDFIKMDIEGAEGAALEGFQENIGKSLPIMIIELHNPQADLAVGKFLSRNNYSAFRFDPFAKLSFEKIVDMTKPYPHPGGIWGSILCLGPNHTLQSFKF